MKKTFLLATAIGLMLPASAYAEDIVLKFWDNQQTEVRPEPVPGGGGEEL